MKKFEMFHKIMVRIETQEDSHTVASTPGTDIT